MEIKVGQIRQDLGTFGDLLKVISIKGRDVKVLWIREGKKPSNKYATYSISVVESSTKPLTKLEQALYEV